MNFVVRLKMSMMRREVEEERNISRRDSGAEYKMEDLTKPSRSSRRFALMEKELGLDSSTHSRFSRENVINGIKGLSQGSVIYPDDRYALSLSLVFERDCKLEGKRKSYVSVALQKKTMATCYF